MPIKIPTLAEMMAPSRPAPVPPSRPPTPAEEAFAARPDAAAKLQESIDCARRIWAAPSLEEGDRIRCEPRARNVDESAEPGTVNGGGR